MDILVMTPSLEVTAIIEGFESFIWTDRYNKCGDFELYAPFSNQLLESTPKGYFVGFEGSDRLMVIDGHTIETDVEIGAHLTIKGRSLESLLERRIIWKRTMLKGSFQDAVLKLLNQNAITPTDVDRAIPGLVFQASTDTRITSLTVESQLTGENLYATIVDMCVERKLGFKIVPNSSGQLVFSLYVGTDRSYVQSVNPYVVFSPEFENLISSKYVESDEPLRNVALVGGEGEGRARKFHSVGTGVGVDRREVFVDAKDVSSAAEVEGGTDLTLAEYNAQLAQKGEEKLAESAALATLEGEADTTRTFTYGTDFFIGDVVQMTNEFGMEYEVRVGEIIFSQEVAQLTAIPTFELLT